MDYALIGEAFVLLIILFGYLLFGWLIFSALEYMWKKYRKYVAYFMLKYYYKEDVPEWKNL